MAHVLEAVRQAQGAGIALDEASSEQSLRAGQVGRAIGAAALLAVVVLAMAGWLGVRSRTATATGEGVELSVEYPQIARGGVPVPLRIEVRSFQPSDEPVTVVVSTSYLSLFARVEPEPQPASSTSADGGQSLLLRFDPPADGVLAIDLSSTVSPSARWVRSGTVEVRGPDGDAVASVTIRTLVLP